MIKYRTTDELQPIELWLRDNSGDLIDFSIYDTFKVELIRGGVASLTKATGIVGAAGAGSEPDGTPNLVVNWSAGELELDAGVYLIVITARDGGLDYSFATDFELVSSSSTSTWTYGGDPQNNSTDAIRFLIGDTESGDRQVTDQEIGYMLAQYPNSYECAARICKALAAKYARCIDKSVGPLSRSFSQKFQHYSELADSLMDQFSSGGEGVGIWGSGWRIADDEAMEANTEIRPLFSNRGDMDNPEYGSDSVRRRNY